MSKNSSSWSETITSTLFPRPKQIMQSDMFRRVNLLLHHIQPQQQHQGTAAAISGPVLLQTKSPIYNFATSSFNNLNNLQLAQYYGKNVDFLHHVAQNYLQQQQQKQAFARHYYQ